MRRRLVASNAADLQPRDHTCWTGDGPQELHALATAAFIPAVQRNERLVFVSEAPRRDWLSGLADVDGLIERDALRLVRVDDVYSYPSRPDQQRVQFEALVDEALADGFSGLFVVADNSRLIGATEADFDAWLRWEALADELQSRRPLTGLCYFDAGVVSADRLDALSMMHPVRCRRSATSSFQLYCDDDALRVSGEIDGILADQIRRVFAAAVGATDRELDFSEVDFIDHRALLTLDEVARAGVRVRLRGAKSVVRRLWGLLEVPQPALEFS